MWEEISPAEGIDSLSSAGFIHFGQLALLCSARPVSQIVFQPTVSLWLLPELCDTRRRLGTDIWYEAVMIVLSLLRSSSLHPLP